MSTIGMTYRRSPNLWWLFILAAIGAAVYLVTVALPPVQETEHASMDEAAEELRACYAQGDLLQRWVYLDEKNGLQRDHCLFELDNGKIGDRIIQFCKRLNGWREVTNTVWKDGSMEATIDYLTRHGCKLVAP